MDDHFADRLAAAIHFDLFEPWREIDAVIRTFCRCSLTSAGSCSVKRTRARSSRSRSCRRVERGKSADPDGDGPRQLQHQYLISRRNTVMAVNANARLDGTRHDGATGSEPEASLDAYAARDSPRAGQGFGEHKIGLTFLAAAAPGKCSRVAFTLPGIAEVIRSDDLTVGGIRLTGLTLSEGNAFTGITASHHGGMIGAPQAAEILQARDVRGIVYVHPDEDGWRVLIPLSIPRGIKEEEPYGENEKRPRRWINVFELFAARVNGLFDGRLDRDVFEPGSAISIGGVRDLKVVDGKFLDRNDRTYRTSVFRDGSTVASRAAAARQA